MHLVNPNVHLPIEGRWWLVFAHRARFMERDPHNTGCWGGEGGQKSRLPLSYQDTKKKAETQNKRVPTVRSPLARAGSL
ncbi:hypothetical protein CEXT_262911 [Caerostris extrusa]|uniref:Uncharacterized protein n=1 Tax=Caerostris extrusa TaxID=172846 RepID=A0AAV4Q565_CAEEX|nr:hypothetical protein CEXT_262911 [Caerostris extrusa]